LLILGRRAGFAGFGGFFSGGGEDVGIRVVSTRRMMQDLKNNNTFPKKTRQTRQPLQLLENMKIR